MKKAFVLNFAFLLFMTRAQGQEKVHLRYGDVTIGVGSFQGSFSFSYGHDWRLGKKQKFGIGVGGRFTSYFGSNQYHRTAPAKLTSGSTGPGVLFKDDITANIDSLLISSPQVNLLNAFINLSYEVSPKILVGFNIDAIGFSFGGSKQANYINGASGNVTQASPTAFNLLLVSENDLGSLNSELYMKYLVKERWSVKGGVQFLFTEYTTVTKIQQFPEPNDRFRNKSLMLALGVSYRLN